MAQSKRQKFIKNSLLGGVAFGFAAAVFIGFSVYYTRAFGVAEYGKFSLLLNTVAALIALGAYDGFLINHSSARDPSAYDRFNRNYFAMNALLAIAAGVVFSAITGRVSPVVVLAVTVAVLFDYRSQSAIAVLVVNDDNWKIRAIRALYQVLLIAVFLVLRFFDVAADIAFAAGLLLAAVVHYVALRYHAALDMAREAGRRDELSDVVPKVLSIAIASNLASVAMMLFDKALIRLFELGTPQELGIYFLYFDLATRVEAFYLLMAVPITNYLFNAVRDGQLPVRHVYLMIVGCFLVGGMFALVGLVIVPPLYGLAGGGFATLAGLFGLYVAARGVRYLTKSVCNACGAHGELLNANLLAFGVAVVLAAVCWSIHGPVMSVIALTGILVAANMMRLASLVFVIVRQSGKAPAEEAFEHD